MPSYEKCFAMDRSLHDFEVIKQDEASGVRDFSAELRETEEVLAEDLATTGVLGATSGGFGIPAPTGTAISSGFFGTDSGWQLEVSSVVAGSSGLAGPSGVVASSGTSEFPGTGSGANVSSGPSGFPGAVSGANPSSGPSGFPGAGSGTNVSSGPSGFLGAVSNSGFAGPSESGPLLLGARGGGVVEGGTAIMHKQAVCVITEQPASKALRFRYECEGRSAGSIPGVNSTPENKTHPTIQIKNYVGRAVVVVSCVTKDSPYRPHPHSLVGKEGCKHGVCTMEVNTETMALAFANLGIQCIKKKDIEAALSQREKLRIDPFKTGYDHRNQPGSIDLNAVRLCFQVFLEGKIKNQFNVAITPVVSEPIYDKKAMSDLLICKLSEDSAPVTGGKQIILLCEKVAKEDISVKLYEVVNNQIVWEGECEFNTTDVHKQVAITFKTPRYKNIEVTEPIVAQIQLVRPSDKAASDPLPFQLTPIHSGRGQLLWSLNRRRKADYRTFANILNTDARLMTCKGVGAGAIDKQGHKVMTLDAVGEEMSVENWGKAEEDDGKADPDRWKKINDAYAELKKNKRGRMVEAGSGNLSANMGGNVVRDGKFGVSSGGDIIDAGGKAGENVNGNQSAVESVVFNGSYVGDNGGYGGGNLEEFSGGNIAEVGGDSFGNVLVIDGNILENSRSVDNNLGGTNGTEEGFTDLLNQVNELDSICVDGSNDFGIYSSLQLAMKNPCEFIDSNAMETGEAYEDIAPPRPTASKPPLPHHQQVFSNVEVENEDDEGATLPPLPPKRVKKCGSPAPPQKTLPPTPEGTKKLSLFQKLFSSTSKRSKSRKNSLTQSVASRKPSVTSLVSRVGLGESGEGDHEKQDMALTEAEHYALYTSLAPHATASEFDEMSFYYSPVEGRPTNADVPVK
ncbi:embryonic polarity protein dorsal isoform X2 [Nilaparvata lugens]|uniref:embryonic polarity protein dorsal isoform X2 n=1 Tax=Nilaparvata lugens TaxID=108931 RepID=UPI00193D5758|nr:embryonic polarity protein dorsal isoform X2 [Nilaparvata lugens]